MICSMDFYSRIINWCAALLLNHHTFCSWSFADSIVITFEFQSVTDFVSIPVLDSFLFWEREFYTVNINIDWVALMIMAFIEYPGCKVFPDKILVVQSPCPIHGAIQQCEVLFVTLVWFAVAASIQLLHLFSYIQSFTPLQHFEKWPAFFNSGIARTTFRIEQIVV